MLIPNEHLRKWYRREKRQRDALIKGLFGHHQKEYRNPDKEFRKLSKDRRLQLRATNHFARISWFRIVASEVAARLGATAPRWIPTEPVFLVTVIDGAHRWLNEDDADESLAKVRKAYEDYFYGLNYVGMIDTALYVSSQRVLKFPKVTSVHAHALVWGISERKLNQHAQRIRKKIKSNIPYTTSFDMKPMKPDDFRQCAWYMLKTPYKQYQIHKRQTERYSTYKGAMNGVNSVLSYRNLSWYRLDELTLAGGDGVKIVEKALATIKRRRVKQGLNENTGRLPRKRNAG